MYSIQVCVVLLFGLSSFAYILRQNDPQGPLILTPYVERGEIDKAKNLSAVNPCHFAGVKSHAAYFTVNKTNKWHLFFWYFPAEGAVLESTPLIIWLQGGPGCSSLYGLFNEIGPIQIKKGTVERRPITWGSDYSLLFIDNPVGTGFSFSEDKEHYVTNEDMVGACLLSLLQQFLQVFPEHQSSPLFIAGESYAGKYIPALGHYIHHNKNDSIPINLKGLVIGDGWIDPPTLMHYSEFLLQIGIIDPEGAKELESYEERARHAWETHNMTQYEENALNASDLFSQKMHPINIYNYADDSHSKLAAEFVKFMNRTQIQDSVHAKRMDYQLCNDEVHSNMLNDLIDTVKPWLEELLEHYGVMCYNGQLDAIVAYALSVHTYRSLNWTGQQDYLNADRYVIYDEIDTSRVNSFVKGSGNFVEVMVLGAGHMVAQDQPRAAKQILDMFVNKFK